MRFYARQVTFALAFFSVALASIGQGQRAPSNLNYDQIAERIVRALNLRENERVLIRFDPGYFNELVEPLRLRIRRAKGIDLTPIEYAETAAGTSPDAASAGVETKADLRDFERLLDTTDVYLWLPLRERIRHLPQQDAQLLARWLDKGGARRQIHFHWSAGSVLSDGLVGQHHPALDLIYQEALDIDYRTLNASQEQAISLLKSGNVRVRTPGGTDLVFRVGARPFNKQNGDASSERVRSAKVRIDREIELPAGVVRVAPLEESVTGTVVVPFARFRDKTATGIRLEFLGGRVVRVDASEGKETVEDALNTGGEAAKRFREFALGFNTKLRSAPGTRELAYFGYGAGVVRLSLGDNQELGGSVRGNFTRWFFFPDATVEVEGRALVRDGKLVPTGR